MDTLDLALGISAIVLAVAAAALCVTLTVGLVVMLPRLRRIADNLEQATQSAAQTASNTAVISQSFADRSDRIAENLAQSTENLNKTMANTAEAAGNAASASRLLGPAVSVANWVYAARGQILGVFNSVKTALNRKDGQSGQEERPGLPPWVRRFFDSVAGSFRRQGPE